MNALVRDNYKEIYQVAMNMTGSREKACDLITETYLVMADKEPPKDGFKFWFTRAMCTRKLRKGEYTKFRTSITQSNNATDADKIPDIPPEEQGREPDLSCLQLHERILLELRAEGLTAAKIASDLKHDGVAVHEKLISNMIKTARKKVRECNKY